MNNLTVSFVLFFIFTSVTFGQNLGNNSQGELFDYIQEREAYFEVLKTTLTEDEFYEEGGEYNRYQRWLKFWTPRIGGHGDFEKYIQDVNDYHTQQQSGLNKSICDQSKTWVEIGPFTTPNTCTDIEQTNIGPMRFVRVSEQDTNKLMAGTLHAGGLFYSGDGGQTWNNSGTDTEWTKAVCNDAIFHPTDDNIVYAAGGMPFDALGYSGQENKGTIKGTNVRIPGYIGQLAAVYRNKNLTDLSNCNWEIIADYQSFHGLPPNFEKEFAILKIMTDKKVNINGDHTLYLATTFGLWKSMNPSAASPIWTHVSIPAPASVIADNIGYSFTDISTTIMDLVYEPLLGSNKIYAMVYFHGSMMPTGSTNGYRVMVTTNDGITWDELPGQAAIFTSSPQRVNLAVSKADHRKLWLLSAGLTKGFVFDGDPAALSWTDLNFTSVFLFGGSYALSVDQQSARYIAYGSLGLSEPGCPGIGKAQMSIYDIISGETTHSMTSHGDVRNIIFHPFNQSTMYIANDGGICSLSEPLSPTSNWQVEGLSDGLGVAQVTSMATSREIPDHVILSLFHDGSVRTDKLYSESNWNPNWRGIGKGDGIFSLMEKKDTNLIYNTDQLGTWHRKLISPSMESSISSTGAIPYATGELNDAFPRHHYISGTTSTSVKVTRHINGATGQVIIDFSILGPDFITATHAPDIHWIKNNPCAPNELYVHVKDANNTNRLFRTDIVDNLVSSDINQVGSWEELPLPKGGVLAGIDFDDDRPGFVYLAYAGDLETIVYGSSTINSAVLLMDYNDLSLYSTTNSFDCITSGFPCEDFSMNLEYPYSYFHTFAKEKGSSGAIYFATDFGVFYTNKKLIDSYVPATATSPAIDGWIELGSGFPHVNPTGIEINYVANKVRVSTFGRGVWEHSLVCPSETDRVESGTYLNDEYFEVLNTIESTAKVETSIKVNYRAGDYIDFEATPGVGFEAESGSNFCAYIHRCSTSGSSYKSNLVIPDENQQLEESVHVAASIGLMLYPNPNNGNFNLELEKWRDFGKRISFAVVKIDGKEAYQGEIESGRATIDMSSMPSGVYIVHLQLGDELYYKKIIKQ